MEFIKAILRSIGLLPRTLLIDELTSDELKILSINARREKAESLIELLNGYRKIHDGKIILLIELGSIKYSGTNLARLYKELNGEQFNFLEFNSPKEFDPYLDYIEVFYLRLLNNKQFIFVCINKSDYSQEQRIEEIFSIKEDYNFDLSKYPNRAVYYESHSSNDDDVYS